MEFWLERSEQCPACRVQITPDNPCRPVLGGLSQQNDEKPEFSTREMRRTRMEVLFKECEGEIERLQRQNEILEEENKILSESITRQHTAGKSLYSEVDEGRLRVLTKKLKEATDLYDQTKKDVKSLKEENRLLKEENGKNGIENQKLRMEVVSRSPRRFGRTTVLAMEAQLEKYKKENTALQKALEKTDAYIEDLEKHLQQYKEAASCSGKTFDKMGEKRKETNKAYQLEEDSFLNSDDSEGFTSKKSTKFISRDDTFEFEMPSPMTKSKSIMSKLSIDMNDDNDSFLKDVNEAKKNLFDDTLESKDDTLELPSPVNNAKKKLKFSEPGGSSHVNDQPGMNDNLGFFQNGCASTTNNQTSLANSGLISSGYNHAYSVNSNVIPANPVQSTLIQSTTFASKPDFNTSMTPDIEDCMKLFEEAERKVEIRKSHCPSSITSDYVPHHQNIHIHGANSLQTSLRPSVDHLNTGQRSVSNSAPSSVSSLHSGQRSTSFTGWTESAVGSSRLIANGKINDFSSSLQMKQYSGSHAVEYSGKVENMDHKLFDPRRSTKSNDFPGSSSSGSIATASMGRGLPGGSSNSHLAAAPGMQMSSYVMPSSKANFNPFMSQSTSNVFTMAESTGNMMEQPGNYTSAVNTAAVTFGQSLSQDYGAS